MEQTIAAVEAQRANLGDAATETALAALRRQLAEIETPESGSSSSSGSSSIDGAPADPEGERRIVTILFSDVTGSTALAEQMDPEAWSEIMGEAFENLIEPVERFGGRWPA